MDKPEITQGGKPLFEEAERERLIEEYLTEEEVENLEKEGFNRDQIASVAKDKEMGDKQWNLIERIMYIIAWIFPP